MLCFDFSSCQEYNQALVRVDGIKEEDDDSVVSEFIACAGRMHCGGCQMCSRGWCQFINSNVNTSWSSTVAINVELCDWLNNVRMLQHTMPLN